jgi:hypothetical protein
MCRPCIKLSVFAGAISLRGGKTHAVSTQGCTRCSTPAGAARNHAPAAPRLQAVLSALPGTDPSVFELAEVSLAPLRPPLPAPAGLAGGPPGAPVQVVGATAPVFGTMRQFYNTRCVSLAPCSPPCLDPRLVRGHCSGKAQTRTRSSSCCQRYRKGERK